MTMLKITAGPYEFRARLESDSAPETCAAFEQLLPFRQKVIPTRWSGESTWIPLGDFDLGIDYENPTSHPAPGEILAYPGGGLSETEILLPYGGCMFSSKAGQLAGNHFLTVVEGQENLRPLGERTLWEGAQDIVFERA
jgi:Protein of unknown function (DUF3830)